ncbi:MAG: hypothetical protein M3A44_07515 [Gammaproteobacteria bacterium]
MFRTHQERLVKELALHGITTMEAANRYLKGGLSTGLQSALYGACGGNGPCLCAGRGRYPG